MAIEASMCTYLMTYFEMLKEETETLTLVPKQTLIHMAYTEDKLWLHQDKKKLLPPRPKPRSPSRSGHLSHNALQWVERILGGEFHIFVMHCLSKNCL